MIHWRVAKAGWPIASHAGTPRGGGEGLELNRRWWITVIVALILADLALITWVLYRRNGGGSLTLWVFVFALSSLVPLANLIGEATERLVDFLGDVSSGLLNATLSNVPELTICIFLLIHARNHFNVSSTVSADFDIIRGLLVGSVINNILLTLGLSVFLGALRHGRLRFDAGRAAGYASMLALAVVGLALPNLASAFSAQRSATDIANGEVLVSVLVSIILIVTYVVYIGTEIFGWGNYPKQTLAVNGSGSHPADEGHAEHGGRAEHEGHGEHGHEHNHEHNHEHIAEHKLLREQEEEAEREREESERRKHILMRQQYPRQFRLAVFGLAGVTLVTVLVAGILVSVTDNVVKDTPLTPLSVGLILFPIVCNLGEAAGSLRAALDKNMETAMSVAAGSSVQMPLFVTPLVVFASLIIAATGMAHPLTLIFPPAELIVVGLVTFVYALVNLDGETTWLEGLQLLAFYVMVAVTAFALPGQ
jgi:Ca2+:H+ antiporter